MSIYQSDPDAAPDSEFEPGALHHLVRGNAGRLLDPRRTPVTIVGLDLETGFMTLRVDRFEDAGATWDIPFEEVDHYQFAHGSRRASDEAVRRLRDVIERLDRALVIEPDPTDREVTEIRVDDDTTAAEGWLQDQSRFLASGRRLPDPATRRGDELLMADLGSFMRERALWEVEEGFAQQYVRNPRAGEIVKGHRIVIAELGLAPYAGTIVRDPATFAGGWSRERRAAHVRARLGFLRALFARLGLAQVELWRGISADGLLRIDGGETLLSASFDERVARSHLVAGPGRPTRRLLRGLVPTDRLFMTYLETAAMNDHYREAEAVLLAGRSAGPDPGL